MLRSGYNRSSAKDEGSRRATPAIWTAALFCIGLSACVPKLPSRLEAHGRTLSVCELSRDFSAYAGQIVSVRGVYFNGLRESCPARCPSGQDWPSVLDLTSSSYIPGGGRVAFATDEGSWDRVDAIAIEQSRKLESAEIWVTVRGYLSAFSRSPIGPCDLVANGMFAGLQVPGSYGAQVVVQRFSDIELKPAPSSPYSYRRQD